MPGTGDGGQQWAAEVAKFTNKQTGTDGVIIAQIGNQGHSTIMRRTPRPSDPARWSGKATSERRPEVSPRMTVARTFRAFVTNQALSQTEAGHGTVQPVTKVL